MPKISIIVPIHNLEPYLPACVDSILTQTFTDFELLLMENGSADSTYEIAESFAKKDQRVKAYKLPGVGVCYARNCGLDEAKGEYIIFIDGDDWVSPDYVSSLYEGAYGVNADICIAPFSLYFEDKAVKNVPRGIPIGLYKGQDKFKLYGERFVCTSIFSKNIIYDNNIRFDEIFEGVEDWLFFVEALLASDCVNIIDKGMYFYRQDRAGQITGRKSFDKSKTEIMVNLKLKEILLEKSIFEEYRSCYEYEFVRNILGKTFGANPFKKLSRSQVGQIIEPLKEELLSIRIDGDRYDAWQRKWFCLFQFLLRHGIYRGFFKFQRLYRNFIMQPLGLKYKSQERSKNQ